MQLFLFKKLHAEGHISDDSLRRLEDIEARRLFPLFWEIRLFLYLGVSLLAGGLGILVYKNIDTIGHQAVLAFIALVTVGSFYYCLRKKAAFSWGKVDSTDSFSDYILLLGCLSLLIFLAYLQYEYGVFGDHYGLATFIPMLILFVTAYVFDHLGVLSLAITNLAAWAGIAITPLSLLKDGNFADHRLIFTGLALGAVLLAAGHLASRRRLKAHFEATYANFGLHLFFIAALSGLFIYDHIYLLWFLGLAGLAYYCYTQAMARRSFYFVLVIVIYTYIALCYTVLRLLWSISISDETGVFSLTLLYLAGSAFGVARLLIYSNRQLKSHDRL